MTQAYFVTGTDTEIGKTTIAAGLLHAARQQGLSTAAAKPVASGCRRTADGLRNDDALAFKWVMVNMAISAVVLLAVNMLEKNNRKRTAIRGGA